MRIAGLLSGGLSDFLLRNCGATKDERAAKCDS